jgi:hypothetical protein
MTTNNAVDVTLSGQSGTGSFVGTTGATLVSPTLGAASATSINFGGTSLANYTEGTWTPSYVGSGGGSATYSTQFASYTRIGNTVIFNATLAISASTLTGNISISGLPFPPAILAACSIWATALANTAITQIMAITNTTTHTLDLYAYATGTATPLTATQLSTTSTIVISGSYHV